MLSSLQILCKWCNSQTFVRNKARVVLSAVIATLAEQRKESQPQKLQLLLKIVKIYKNHVQNLFLFLPLLYLVALSVKDIRLWHPVSSLEWNANKCTQDCLVTERWQWIGCVSVLAVFFYCFHCYFPHVIARHFSLQQYIRPEQVASQQMCRVNKEALN